MVVSGVSLVPAKHGAEISQRGAGKVGRSARPLMNERTFCATSGGIDCMPCVNLACTAASCVTSSLEEAPFTSKPHFMPTSLHLNS